MILYIEIYQDDTAQRMIVLIIDVREGSKADDLEKDQNRRSRSKADNQSNSRRSFVKTVDLWVKADDPGRKRTLLSGFLKYESRRST